MPFDGPPAPWRDPRYAAVAVACERREGGEVVLVNAAPASGPHATASGPLERWAALAPGRTWLAERGGEGWRTLSYAEAAQRTAELAGGLEAMGLGPGRPLMITAGNGIDHALLAYAAMRIGCPIAPVSPQYVGPRAEPSRLAHALALIRPAVLVVETRAAAAATLGAAGLAPGTPVIALDEGLGALEMGRAAPDRARGGDLAKLLLTSGSTGAPKAVAITHANLAINAAQVTACYDDPEPPVVVNSAPWSHSLGANAILHMVAHRGGVLFIDAGQPVAGRFGETLRNLAEVETTYLNIVPAGWALLADALDRDDALAKTVFARLRVMQYGGAGLPAAVLARVQAAGVRACGERVTFGAGYGSTETGPTGSNIRWCNDRSGLLGSPIPETAVKLAPAAGGKLEVRIKGPQVAAGYRLADGSVRPLELDDEGFYATGDAGRMANEAEPWRGIVFDGRLVENFKLATGAFVIAGALRLAAVSAMGAVAADAVVCGENREGVGLLVFLNGDGCRALEGAGDAAPHACPAAREAVRRGLARMNAEAKGVGGRVGRALLLPGAPDAASGELTDKGYLNQALARSRRAAEVERLFAAEPDADVIVL